MVKVIPMKTRPLFGLLALLSLALLAGCSDDAPGTYQGYIEGEYVYVA